MRISTVAFFLALVLAAAPEAAVAADSDQDGLDDVADNCLEVANPSQCDTDQDGYGNHCDGDFNQDGVVDGADFDPIFLDDYQAGVDSGVGTDMNCDGFVNAFDFDPLFLSQYTKGGPGPSGVDGDGDGVPDVSDNCPEVPNPDQHDLDGDGIGWRCGNITTWNQLVVLVHREGSTVPDLTPAEFLAVMPAQRDFYREITDYQLHIRGAIHPDQPADVVGWIPEDGSKENLWANLLPIIDPGDYDLVTYVYSTNETGANGNATMDWKEPRDWPDGQTYLQAEIHIGRHNINSLIQYGDPTNVVYLLRHEFGHIYYFGHTAYLDCADAIQAGTIDPNNLFGGSGSDLFNPPTACTADEQSAPFNIMSGGLGYPHVVHLDWANWLADGPLAPIVPRGKLQTATQSGTYTIEPLMGPDGPGTLGVKALRIPRANDTHLYLEYRRRYGADASIPSAFDLDGALVYYRGPGMSLTKYLIDPVPPFSKAEVALPVGAPFYDAPSGATIEVQAQDEYGLTVEITFDE